MGCLKMISGHIDKEKQHLVKGHDKKYNFDLESEISLITLLYYDTSKFFMMCKSLLLLIHKKEELVYGKNYEGDPIYDAYPKEDDDDILHGDKGESIVA